MNSVDMYDDSLKVRVFVSSTFRDMHEEREILVKQIFPQLRKLCEERGVTFTEVDLRWGITEDQAERGEVLPICMAEIERCRPYFIGLLGERYGCLAGEIPEELVGQQPWLKEHLERSITELEILHGVLNNPTIANRACFYFRDPAYVARLPEDHRPDFLEQEPAAREKLLSLKNRIRQSGLAVREDYPNPNTLGQWVLKDLSGFINQQFPLELKPEPLDREAFEHETFASTRTRVYIRRQVYFDRINEHVDSTGEPLLILGESGSGKSALLANWVTEYRLSHVDDFILMHFVGASRISADWSMMLRRIMGELKRRFDLEQEIPDKADELRSAFINCLHKAGAKATRESCRIVLVIDALNQLEDREGALDLVWIPQVIPSSLRLIVSTLPGRPLDHLRERKWPTLTVELLEIAERRQLIHDYLRQYTKKLSVNCVDRILDSQQTANPLYLRTLLEELRVFGAHERLDERMGYYLAATAIDDLYNRILERYEQDYDLDSSGLVREVMSLLWASRRGLSEAELLDLLSSTDDPLPRARWSPLYLATEQSLISRGGLIGFSHEYLRRAVEFRYLASADSQYAVHKRLAEYFRGRQLNHRVLDELPWQLTKAEDWATLRSLVIDSNIMEALFDFSATEFGYYVLLLLERTSTDVGTLYQDFLRNPENFAVHTITIIHNLLLVTGSLDLAETLSGHIVKIAEESGSPEVFGKALLLAIRSRKAKSDYDYEDLLKKAEPIFRDLGDQENIARCLAHRADFYKYQRRDLRAAIKYHQKQETVLREIRSLMSLAYCLNNQAVMYGRLMEPEKQIELRLEVQKIARECGDRDLMAFSDSNLGMFYLQASLIQRKYLAQGQLGRFAHVNELNEAGVFLLQFGNVHENLRKGWILLSSAESDYRVLLKPNSLAGVLRHQVEALWDLIKSPFSEEIPEITEVISRVAMPKAHEARELYLKFGDWRRNEVQYMDELINGMIQWVESTRASQMLGLGIGSLAQALSIENNEQTSSEEDINREFALFILHQEHRQEMQHKEGLISTRIIVKVVKEVKGMKFWEIQNCPDVAYDELDQLGLIPQRGIVSRPGNTAISPGREAEVFAYLEKRGLEFEKIES